MNSRVDDWVARRVPAATPEERFVLLTRTLPPLLDGCEWFAVADGDDVALDVAVPSAHAGVLNSGALGPEPVTVMAPPVLDPALFPGATVPDGFAALLVDASSRAVEVLTDVRGTLQMEDFEVSIAVVALVSSNLGQPKVEPVLTAAASWVRRVADRLDGRVDAAPPTDPPPPPEIVMGARAVHAHLTQLCGPDLVGNRLRAEAALYRRLAHAS